MSTNIKTVYFLHDNNARNDAKLIRLRRLLGLEGIGIYWCIVECINSQENKHLPIDELEDVLYDLKVERRKFNVLVNECKLFKITEKGLTSDAILKRAEIIAKKRKAGSKGGQTTSRKLSDSEDTEKKPRVKLTKEEKEEALGKKTDKFTSQVMEFDDIYLQNMLEDFIRYWTEPNKSLTKQRWENERTWDLKRRLITWAKNDAKYGNRTTSEKVESRSDFFSKHKR